MGLFGIHRRSENYVYSRCHYARVVGKGILWKRDKGGIEICNRPNEKHREWSHNETQEQKKQVSNSTRKRRRVGMVRKKFFAECFSSVYLLLNVPDRAEI